MTEFRDIGGIAADGDGANDDLTDDRSKARVPIADLIAEMVDATRVRRHSIKMQSRNDRPTDAMIVFDILKMPHDIAKGKRREWFGKAAELRASIEAAHELEFGTPRKGSSLAALKKRARPPEWMDAEIRGRAKKKQALVITNKLARSMWDRMRDDAEQTMCAAAEKLPVYPWWAEIEGVKALGLAFIIGVAGDLSNYPDARKPGRKGWDCLYRRLGLAPYKGRAGGTWRRGKEGKLSAEEWTDFGYNSERLGDLFGVITIPFSMRQARVNGPYHAVKVARRAETDQRFPYWKDARRNHDALRIMTKRLLRDLWRAWRAATSEVPEEANDVLPPADKFSAAV